MRKGKPASKVSTEASKDEEKTVKTGANNEVRSAVERVLCSQAKQSREVLERWACLRVRQVCKCLQARRASSQVSACGWVMGRQSTQGVVLRRSLAGLHQWVSSTR
jgi:hypothetical protein